tara:strand:+ start:7619 stop:9217 length:1599 start_codon:yes stop_codon:yes gene_type:complete
MAVDNIGEALLLLSKVSGKLNDKIDNLEKTISKTTGAVDGKPKRFIEKPKPVIVSDFGRKAEKDLQLALKPSEEEDKDLEKKNGFGFVKKLIGPALLVLGGLAALVTGLMSDGPLKGLLNILSKTGIIGGVKLFQKMASTQIGKFTTMFAKILPKNLFDNVIKSAKGFLGNIGKFLLAPFKGLVGKGGAKALFGTIGKLFTKTLRPLLKRIPGIGSLISWSFAVSRFKKGDAVGGLIDVASGIATLFPGIGTALSIGLDVLNAFIDMKKDPEEVKPKGEGFNLGKFFGNIKDAIMNNFPIKNLVEFYSGAGKVVTGNFKEGFKQMAYAIPFFKPLSEFIFGTAEESKDESGKFSFTQFFGNIKDKILTSMLNILPETILGVSVRARAAKMLGIDMGPVNGLPAGYKEGDITPQEIKKYKDDIEGMSVGEANKYIRAQRKGVEVKNNVIDNAINNKSNEEKTDNSLDKITFSNATNSTIEITAKQNTLLEKNNLLLTQILEKINNGSSVINTTNNTSIMQNNNGVKQFRELYA